MRRTLMIPALLVAGLAGLGGLTQTASAQGGGWRDGPGYGRGEGPDGYGWRGRRWNDNRRDDDESGPRWRDGDDRRGYGPREGRRGGENCGPGMGRGMGPGMGRGMGHGMGPGMGHGMGRGYGWRDDSGRGDGPREGRRGPGRFGGMFGTADLDSVKRELSITAAQEAAWTKYSGAMKEAADAMNTRREAMRASVARNLSVEDHRKLRDSMMEQRRKEVDAVRNAADELVKSLDEKQVAIAKEVLPGYAFGPGMRGAGMGWGGSRHH